MIYIRLSFAIFIACIVFIDDGCAQSTPWADVKRSKSGVVTAYWYESVPFIDRQNGKMIGIEYDLLEDFRKFLKRKHQINLEVNWQQAESFIDIIQSVKSGKPGVTFGVSAFSITDKRKAEVDFTMPYMSDISVMITNQNVEAMSTTDQFFSNLPKLTAITIEGTTYEEELKRLKTQGQMDFDIQYIPSYDNIMTAVAARENSFGFIDLPVYMLFFKNDPSIKVRRQNLFPIKREGYGIIFSRGSDWAEPLNEYFSQPDFKANVQTIISKYIDADLYQFVEGLAVKMDNNEIKLLTKEKEIQYQELLGKADVIMKETRMNQFLVALVSIVLASLFVIIVLYKKRDEQNEEIAAQKIKIEIKSAELAERNDHLLAIDQEKNQLIKILAHDLRAPISHIQGLAQIVLLENRALTQDQQMLVHQIKDSAVRVNKMIGHLLNLEAIENNKLPLSVENFDVSELVRNVANRFQPQAEKKKIVLLCNTQKPSVVMQSDPIFLEEILENLVANALKFSPENKVVEVSLSVSENSVHIDVTDQGPGLTDEDKNNLFKKFQKLSARPTAGESSFGLGLSIVKKYVELLHGTVTVTSSPGQGARFRVELPKVLQA